ncbi:MAG: hypothetical protein KDE34_18960 [Anaerolineales bacterium]|nr:hypothetical protein [Anaerolineales bacterium]
MSSQQLIDTLRRINQARLGGNYAPIPLLSTPISIVESLNRASRRLAIYGPSKLLSRELRELPGVWENGAVHGPLVERGDAEPGWLWDPDGPAAPVRVFKGETLPDHWAVLDEAAGADLIRLLVPVLIDGRTRITNMYALREPAGGETA